MKAHTHNIHCNDLQSFQQVFSGALNGAKIAIIFEGGALRGVLSCGYGRALQEILPADRAYSLYGSSSGALNSIYYLTGQLELAHSIYVENATDKKCTNVWNFPNILNVDWLLDNWIFGAKRFDWDRVTANKTHAFISLTRMKDGSAKYIDATEVDALVLNKAMKATSYAPLLTNATQFIDGEECGDGAISDAVPYWKALDDGCTHVICLLTRPKNYRKGEGRFFGRWFKYLRLARQTSAYRQAYWEGERRYNELLDYLYSDRAHVPTLIVSPASGAEIPHNIETKPSVIDSLGRRAYNLAKSQLATLFPVDTP